MKTSTYTRALAAMLLAGIAPSAMAVPAKFVPAALANSTVAAPANSTAAGVPSSQQPQDPLKPEVYYCTDKDFGGECKREAYALDTCSALHPISTVPKLFSAIAPRCIPWLRLAGATFKLYVLIMK